MLIFLVFYTAHSVNQYCADSSCSSCTSGYNYLSKSCLSICPSTYETNSQSCQSQTSNDVFKIDLFKYQDYSTSTVGDFTSFNNKNFNYYEETTGIPTKDRGFYFKDTSVGLKHISSKVPAPDLTLKFLIKFFSAGVIFSLNDGANNIILLSVYSSGVNFGFSLSFQYLDNTFVTTNKQVDAVFAWKVWHTSTITIKQSSDSITINVSGKEDTFLGEFKGLSSTVCIGNCLNLASFKGFLYYFYMINTYDKSHYEDYSPVDCLITEYYDYENSVCTGCGSKWPPCTYSSTNSCFSPSCSGCTSYSYSGCTSCETGTAPSCKCGKNCGTCTSTFECNSCTEGTLIDGLCLFPLSTDLAGKFQTVDLVFNYFSGTFGPFKSGADKENFHPKDSPAVDDPIPAKNRGLYFNGQAFLASSSSFSVNYQFSLVYWIRRISGNGVWSSNFFNCYLDTHCKIKLSSPHENRIFATGRKIFDASWRFISYTLQFEGTISTFTTKINDVLIEDFTASGYVFYDEGGEVYVGKVSSDFFVGFIYLIQLKDYFSTSSVYSDSACGSLNYGKCLWDCEITEYIKENTIESCDADCTNGCVRSDSCNLCSDLKCEKCSSFEGGCTECISGTVKNGDSCECPSDTYFDEKLLICIDCSSECTSCTSEDTCKTCQSGLILVEGKCLCSNSKQYWDQNSCLNCQEGCVTCTKNTCEKCPDGTYFISASWSCKPCSVPCLTCSSSSECITCIENSERVGSDCLCIKDYGFNGKICEKCENYSLNGYCQECPVLCSKCESDLKCSSCESRSILQEGLCECIEGDTIINNHCKKCESFIEDKVCQSCPDLCTSCSARNECLSCIENSEIRSGVCKCLEGFIQVNQSCSTCPSSTFFSKGRCEECPRLCEECLSSEFCTQCIKNAEKVDTLCQCQGGYSGEKCSRSYFSFTFEIFSNNSFVLLFSEALGKTLTKNELHIIYDEKAFRDFFIFKISMNEFLIDMEFEEDVKEGKILSVFIDQQLLSIQNSLLNSTNFDFQVSEFLTEKTKNFQNNEKIGTSISQVFISISAFSAVFNNQNPSAVWGFISLIQALCYMRLLAFELPVRFDGLLKGLTNYNIIPNLFEGLIVSQEIAVHHQKIEKFGFNTSNILENTGKIILILITMIVINILLFGVKMISICVKSHAFQLKMNETLSTYKFNKYLRFYIQSYLDILASSCIAILSFNKDFKTQSVNFTFALLLMIICALSPIFSLLIFKHVKKNPETLSVFSTLSYEFKSTSETGLKFFYACYFLERFILMITLVFLYKLPWAQLIINLFFSLLVFFT
jgi:hypothetical protein